MKVTVINERESVIYNDNIYRHGETFEVEEVIGESLIARGYVAMDSAVEEAEPLAGNLDANQLKEMSYPELKALAAQMGLDAKGKKDELIARICGEEVEVEEDAVVNDAPSDDLPNTAMPE